MPPNPDPLEKDIEKAVCDHAKSLGCLCYKFTSPSKRSVPDREFILPDGKGVFFIEFKRKGAKPTTGQQVEIDKIRAKGIQVFVIDNKLDGKELVTLIAHRGKMKVCSECYAWKGCRCWAKTCQRRGTLGCLCSNKAEDY